MSTSFLVIQAQRDLAQARTNELCAVLAYDLSLVDFEALQESRAGADRYQRTFVVINADAPLPQAAARWAVATGTVRPSTLIGIRCRTPGQRDRLRPSLGPLPFALCSFLTLAGRSGPSLRF